MRSENSNSKNLILVNEASDNTYKRRIITKAKGDIKFNV